MKDFVLFGECPFDNEDIIIPSTVEQLKGDRQYVSHCLTGILFDLMDDHYSSINFAYICDNLGYKGAYVFYDRLKTFLIRDVLQSMVSKRIETELDNVIGTIDNSLRYSTDIIRPYANILPCIMKSAKVFSPMPSLIKDCEIFFDTNEFDESYWYIKYLEQKQSLAPLYDITDKDNNFLFDITDFVGTLVNDIFATDFPKNKACRCTSAGAFIEKVVCGEVDFNMGKTK